VYTSGAGAGEGAGASHIHNGIPHVHSMAGVGGGAGATSTSLRSILILVNDVLVFSIASPMFFEVTGFALALVGKNSPAQRSESSNLKK